VSLEKLIGYVRDAGCVLVGLGGITYQIVTGQVDGQLLTTCMDLLGIAGGIRGVAAAAGFELWWAWTIVVVSVAGIAIALILAGR
jgi:hypothetical protein